MSEKETLINTLLANGLASSRSEAQRMADNMISTSDKVNESMRTANHSDNSMVKDYGEQRRAAQASQAAAAAEPVQTPITGSPKEQKIEELRRSALNPQPINIQTEFDTPANEQKQAPSTDFSAEVPSEPSLPDVQANVEVEHSPEPQESAVAEVTPESYAAQQMTNLGAATVSDLTTEPSQPAPEAQEIHIQDDFANEPQSNFAQEPVEEAPAMEQTLQAPMEPQSSSLESGFPAQEMAAEPLEKPMAEAPRDFISQEPELPMETPSLEPSLPTPQETAQEVPLESVGAPIAQEPPQESTQQAPQEEPEKKKVGYTEAEKKLAEEVDLSKVFNFSNR